MKITVYDPVKRKDGTWDIVKYEREKEFPESEGRHSELCVYCGFPSYPECRGWCHNEKLAAGKS